jgi:hypothetical protein
LCMAFRMSWRRSAGILSGKSVSTIIPAMVKKRLAFSPRIYLLTHALLGSGSGCLSLDVSATSHSPYES